MFGRKSVKESVTKGGEVVILSVAMLYLTLALGLGFMNFPVSSGEGIIYSSIGNSNPPNHFPIPDIQEEVGGAGQPVM